MLQSSLMRAVVFSALTTATAFGALWLSSHPGTASMGRLLMISLGWELLVTLLFRPYPAGAAAGKAGSVAATGGAATLLCGGLPERGRSLLVDAASAFGDRHGVIALGGGGAHHAVAHIA